MFIHSRTAQAVAKTRLMNLSATAPSAITASASVITTGQVTVQTLVTNALQVRTVHASSEEKSKFLGFSDLGRLALMEIGNVVEVNSCLHSNQPEEGVILRVEGDSDPAPCKCGKLGCRVFQTVALVGKPGILRYVPECAMTLVKPSKEKH